MAKAKIKFIQLNGDQPVQLGDMKLEKAMKTLLILVATLMITSQVNAGCVSPDDNYAPAEPCGANPNPYNTPYYTPLDTDGGMSNDDTIATKAKTEANDQAPTNFRNQQTTSKINQPISQQLNQRR